jgi:hypothetical protein
MDPTGSSSAALLSKRPKNTANETILAAMAGLTDMRRNK